MTNDNLKQFEEWYVKIFTDYKGSVFKWCSLKMFNILPLRFQEGVFESYYDSLGFIINVKFSDTWHKYNFSVTEKYHGGFHSSTTYETLKEAKLEALKYADKEVNKKLNQQNTKF